MLEWLAANAATIVVSVLLLVALGVALRSILKAHKRGGCVGCSGCCGTDSVCSHCSQCGSDETAVSSEPRKH